MLFAIFKATGACMNRAIKSNGLKFYASSTRPQPGGLVESYFVYFLLF